MRVNMKGCCLLMRDPSTMHTMLPRSTHSGERGCAFSDSDGRQRDAGLLRPHAVGLSTQRFSG